jgi:hypothetical protein
MPVQYFQAAAVLLLPWLGHLFGCRGSADLICALLVSNPGHYNGDQLNSYLMLLLLLPLYRLPGCCRSCQPGT